MNQAHNLSTGSGMVWIPPPYLTKADMAPQGHTVMYPRLHLNCPAEQLRRGAAWRKPFCEPSHDHRIIWFPLTLPLLCTSSQTTLWSLSPSVSSVTWPSLNEVLKRFPWADLAPCAHPPSGTIVVDLLYFLTSIIYSSQTSGCEPSGC